MLYGSEPRENGHLILSLEEKERLITEHPEAKKFIKKITGSCELIRGIERWCLWITDSEVKEARKIPFIQHRLQKVTVYRNTSSRKDTVKFADRPHRFTSITHKDNHSIIVPIVSSERREYIPVNLSFLTPLSPFMMPSLMYLVLFHHICIWFGLEPWLAD